jgi:hypothetical protein
MEHGAAVVIPERHTLPDVTKPISRFEGGNWSDALASACCVAAVILTIASVWPFCEMAFVDDWSYAYMALKTSATGHLVYNGWTAPMLGVQAFWGAEWIRLLGFSFNVLRFSTLPFVAGCTAILYSLFRACGLSRQLVIFGVIGVMTSPLMLPFEASFMSDLPALFFLLLCFWCCQRVVEAQDWGPFVSWSALLFVAGLAGGTVRQTDWLAPFVIFPVLALSASKSRGLVLWSFWLTGIASALALDLWLTSQPYYYSMPLFNTEGWLLPALFAVRNSSTLLIELACLMFPVLCLALRLKAERPKAGFIAACTFFFGTVFLVSILVTDVRPVQLIAGNTVTEWGVITSGGEIPGQKAIALPYPIQLLLVAGATVSAFMLVNACRKWPRATFRRAVSSSSRMFVGPFIAFTGLYLALVAARTLSLTAHDRYLMPVLPLTVVLALMAFQELGIRRPSKMAVISLLAISCWGLAATHDYFAESRARLEAANELLTAGVPRQQISGGLEFDGWTELLTSGHIPNVQPHNVHGALLGSGRRQYTMRPPFWFWAYTPSVDPKYILSRSHLDNLRDADFGPVEYRTWLPPFFASIVVQEGNRLEVTDNKID